MPFTLSVSPRAHLYGMHCAGPSFIVARNWTAGCLQVVPVPRLLSVRVLCASGTCADHDTTAPSQDSLTRSSDVRSPLCPLLPQLLGTTSLFSLCISCYLKNTITGTVMDLQQQAMCANLVRIGLSPCVTLLFVALCQWVVLFCCSSTLAWGIPGTGSLGAAVCGVARSRTRLERLSSTSSFLCTCYRSLLTVLKLKNTLVVSSLGTLMSKPSVYICVQALCEHVFISPG